MILNVKRIQCRQIGPDQREPHHVSLSFFVVKRRSAVEIIVVVCRLGYNHLSCVISITKRTRELIFYI